MNFRSSEKKNEHGKMQLNITNFPFLESSTLYLQVKVKIITLSNVVPNVCKENI